MTSTAASTMPVTEVDITTTRGVFRVLKFGACDAPESTGPLLVYVHGTGMNGWGFKRVADCVHKLSAGAKATPEAILGLSRPAMIGGSTTTISRGPPLPTAKPGGAQMPPRPTVSAPASTASKGGGGGGYRGLALDLRCHGGSTDDGGAGSLTMEVLVEDCFEVITTTLSTHYPGVRTVYLVGHSLGGAVVVHLAHRKPVLPIRIGAVVVLDVVEGTAKQSLAFMKGFLDKRPTSFKDTDAAVKWFMTAGGMKNPESAQASVPTLLTRKPGGAGDDDDATSKPFIWRTDLAATLPLWPGWFEDLDAKFIACPASKMLVLAGTDRLDKELTIAQMQGKFQFEVMGGGVGHYLMEDAPEVLAAKLTRLVDRNEALIAKLPPQAQ